MYIVFPFCWVFSVQTATSRIKDNNLLWSVLKCSVYKSIKPLFSPSLREEFQEAVSVVIKINTHPKLLVILA